MPKPVLPPGEYNSASMVDRQSRPRHNSHKKVLSPIKASPIKGVVPRERRESKTHDEGIKMNITLIE